MSDPENVIVLRREDRTVRGKPVQTREEGKRSPLPRRCIVLSMQILDPPEPIKHPRD